MESSSRTQGLADGAEVAFWFNGRAKRVTPRVVEAFAERLPAARMFVTRDLMSARRAAGELVREPPQLLFCGGGDGTVVHLLNLLREEGAKRFPTIALLRLGTGNGWPLATRAPRWLASRALLSSMPLHPPRSRFQLVEVEGRLCHFAGVGWDATILRDYQRNLQKRADQLLASRLASKLHKSMFGYLYSTARITVPEEVERKRRYGRTRVKVENLGEPALTLDGHHRPVPAPPSPELFEGPVSVAAGASEPFWGGGFMAFPHARLVPNRINIRVYTRSVLHAVPRAVSLWLGGKRDRGMHDFFVTGARLTFSQPMPFQIGGDVIGPREQLDLRCAAETVELLDWSALR